MEEGRKGRNGGTYTVLSRQIKMPQYLLIHAQTLLMHPRRDPLFFLSLPIPFDLRLGHPGPFLLDLAPRLLLSFDLLSLGPDGEFLPGTLCLFSSFFF